MKFSAAILEKTGQPLKIIHNIEIPKLKEGQVLVKMSFAGVCHSQLMEVTGGRGKDQYLPHMLGHEGTGVVLDVGAGVRKVAKGQKVVLGWLKGKGIEAGGSIYSSSIGNINAGPVTTFSEYSVVSENRCYLLPDALSMAEGVLFGCAIPTGTGIITNRILPSNKNHIGIFGLGGIGMSALFAAAREPHRTLIAIDINPNKLAIAESLGATHCLNAKDPEFLTKLEQITKGNMLDYVIEAAGSCKTIELAFSLINGNTGNCIFASHPPAGEKIQIDPHELICGKTIRGTWGGESDPEKVISDLSKVKNELPLANFMSIFYCLEDINIAMQALREQKVLRAIIKFEEH